MINSIKTGSIICLIFLFFNTIVVPIHASEADSYMEQTLSLIQKGDFKQAILSGTEAERLYREKGMTDQRANKGTCFLITCISVYRTIQGITHKT